MDIKNQLNSIFDNVTKQIEDQVTRELVALVKERVSTMDFRSLVAKQVTEVLQQKIQDLEFPEKSISACAIDFTGVSITGDNVIGGIIQNFGSTGIDDQATTCQLTILDSHVVIESPVVTTGIESRGDVTITGNLSVAGIVDQDSDGIKQLIDTTVALVKQELNEEMFTEYAHLVAENIRTKGIEFGEVLINSKLALSETRLGPAIVWSNLQRLGELDELQVKGETFLGRSVYVGNKRLGINTMEPSAALSVWDEEVEIVAKKQKQNCGFIGTTRLIDLVIGVGGRDNIVLDSDGAVTINDLRLGAVPFSTASVTPTWSGRAGEIVFNDSPAVGNPIGWVCIEGNRWGHFGIIQ